MPANIQPVYETLSNDDLLQRCTGGNTKNYYESFKASVWKLAPKHLHCGSKAVEVCGFIATGLFNEAYSSILDTMKSSSETTAGPTRSSQTGSALRLWKATCPSTRKSLGSRRSFCKSSKITSLRKRKAAFMVLV